MFSMKDCGVTLFTYNFLAFYAHIAACQYRHLFVIGGRQLSHQYRILLFSSQD